MSAPGPAPPPARLRRRRFSYVWLIPLIAAVIAAWLGYRTYMEQGPLLTLSFNNADGLNAGQTQVKYKAVALGTVESIDLSKDNSHVIVRVRMNNVGARFLTSHARFWVEGAHLSLTDPSSIGSLVSGAYIAVDPGKPGGHFQDHFVGLEGPPGVRSDEPGRTYILTTDRIGSLRTGSPVLFRGATVGEVLGYNLGNGLTPVKVSIFVRAPFDDLVRPQSQFWNSSGIAFVVQPGQFRLEFDSLQALLTGAVTFNLPQAAANTRPSAANAVFPLYGSQSQAESASYARLIPAVAYFHESVAGLQKGAAVEILGMQIGVVTGVSLILDPHTGEEKVRVAMALQPERNAHEADFKTSAETAALIDKFVNRGMRAEVTTASYLTGEKVISFVTVPGAKPVKLQMEGDAYVLPTQPSNLNGALASLSNIAAKLEQVPFDQLADNLNRLLKTANGTLGSRQTKEAITSLSSSMKSLNVTLRMLKEDYGNDSEFQRDLEELMRQATGALSSLRQLSDYLDRHPSSLVFGRGR